MTSRTGFSMGVHGARGLFAFAVLIFHVFNSGLPSWELPALAVHFLSSFKFGVELFFAISGFVILGTVQRARTPVRFLINRATRIFPVLWVAILTVVVLSIVSGRWTLEDVSNTGFLLRLTGNLMALPGIFDIPLILPPAWTLSYEFTFYLLCYLYLVAQRRLHLNATLPLFLAGFVLIALYPRALFFLGGLVVFTGLVRGRIPLFLSRFPALLLLVFLAAWQGTAMSLESLAEATEAFFPPVWVWNRPDAFLLAVIAFAAATLMLHGIAQGHGWFGGWFLQSRPMIWLGTVSYSLYLWHPVVLAIIKAGMYATGLPELLGNWSQVAFFCLAAPPSLILAHFSQVLLERHATKALRDFLVARLSRQPKPETGSRTTVRSQAIEPLTGSRDV